MDIKKKKQKKRLYSINLREKIHLCVLNPKIEKILLKTQSFLRLKRYIYQMRFYGLNELMQISFYKKRRIVIVNENENLFYLKRITFTLSKVLNKTKSISRTNSPFVGNLYSSLHLAFSFLEEKWLNSFSILKVKMPSSLHPELFIRIVSSRIEDIAFIDLLRRSLNITKVNLLYPIYSQNNIDIDITPILINIISLEVETFLQFELTNLLVKSNQNVIRQLNFLRKINCFNIFYKVKNIKTTSLSRRKKKINVFNYLYYANKWIFSIDIESPILEILKNRCIRYFKYRIGILVKYNNWSITNIYEDYSFFLGMKFLITVQKLKIKNFTFSTLMLPQVFYIKKVILIMIPVSNFINVLSQYGFCKRNGYPISKTNWSTWPDLQIIERFSQILNNINYYYSGCANKKKIGYIEYILAYSCAKTLACKHKTNVRSIWYNYTRDFIRYSLFLKKNNTLKKNSIDKNFFLWDLSKQNIDFIFFFLTEESYNKYF